MTPHTTKCILAGIVLLLSFISLATPSFAEDQRQLKRAVTNALLRDLLEHIEPANARVREKIEEVSGRLLEQYPNKQREIKLNRLAAFNALDDILAEIRSSHLENTSLRSALLNSFSAKHLSPIARASIDLAIKTELLKDPRTSKLKIRVHAEPEGILLRGAVRTLADKKRVEVIARGTIGLSPDVEIINLISVKPNAASEDFASYWLGHIFLAIAVVFLIFLVLHFYVAHKKEKEDASRE